MTDGSASTPTVTSIEIARAARRGKATQPTLDDLFRADLARSGLTVPNAQELGFHLADADELWRLLRPKNPERPRAFTAEGFVIPYFDPGRRRIPFFRVRKLRGRWGEHDDGSQRYASPLNSLPHLYLPAPVFLWLPSKADELIRVDRLLNTEGEKKAAKACLMGIPCVALGGVDAYRSTKHGIFLLDEYQKWFDLSKTAVEFVYDSDAYQNPDVNRALRGLSDALRRDASPASLRQKRLTAENVGGKTALDDFLAGFTTGEAARRGFNQVEATDDPVSEAFATFNREIAHVRKKTCYYNIAIDTFYPSQKKVTEEYARGTPVLGTDGKPFYPIARWYTERPPETEVLDVCYSPGLPERYRPADATGDILNTWRPGPLVPEPYKRAAQVAEFLAFFDYLTPGLTAVEKRAFLDWMAYPLQNRGKKVRWAVMIWSRLTGTGKNTLGHIIGKCHGASNTREIDGTTLMSQFNNWALCQFAIINEVHLPTYGERTAVMARLKTLVTDEVIDLHRKYLNQECAPNHVHLYLTSNHHDALTLEEDDRRFFVVHAADDEKKWPDEKFATLNAWLDDGGYEKVFGYLLKRDLRSFNPYAAAPRTAARAEMLGGRSSPVDDLVSVLVTTPAVVLGVGTGDEPNRTYTKPDRELYLPDQLIAAVHELAKRRMVRVTLTVGILGAALKRHGVVKKTMEFKKNGRRTITAYALFRADHWRAKDDKAWREHLRAHNPELEQ